MLFLPFPEQGNADPGCCISMNLLAETQVLARFSKDNLSSPSGELKVHGNASANLCFCKVLKQF